MRGRLFVDLPPFFAQYARVTPTEARNWLIRTTRASSDPVVGNTDLDAILAECALEDEAGLAPSEVGWAGVYDLNLAAAMVYEIKAAMVATEFNFSADGARYDRVQKREAFMALAQSHRNRRNASFSLDPEDEDALSE